MRWLRVHPPSSGVAVWVVPALNPDGLLANRKNSARDVDLNRNFPARNYRTDTGPATPPAARRCPSPRRAPLAGWSRRRGPTWPGWWPSTRPFACINYDGPAAGWAEAVAAACGWPAQADIGYPTPGSLGSWLGVDRGLPVLTIELPVRFGYRPVSRARRRPLCKLLSIRERIR